jgi:hypothetical protein
MAMPVVTVAAGGLPVINIGPGNPPYAALPVIEALNGFGIAVTVVTAPRPGLPVIFVPQPAP